MAKGKHYLTENAKLMAEWDWEKNEKSPDQFTLGSNQKVWWKCEKGHEWEARINSRSDGNGCPYCSGRYAIKGENDLQTVNPDLAKEWNYEKNNGLMPNDVLPSSNKKVWWKCDKGHEWQSTIANRTDGHGCPYCSGRFVIKGENDLQTVNPDLAKEWNYEKNNELTPSDFLPNSNKKVWWKCSKGHEWQSTINNRNKGRGCPKCAKIKLQSFVD